MNNTRENVFGVRLVLLTVLYNAHVLTFGVTSIFDWLGPLAIFLEVVAGIRDRASHNLDVREKLHDVQLEQANLQVELARQQAEHRLLDQRHDQTVDLVASLTEKMNELAEKKGRSR